MALARVQTTAKVIADSATTLAITFSSPPAIGNAVIVSVITNRTGGGPATLTATDTHGNTYSTAAVAGTADAKAWILACGKLTATGTPFTVTVTAPVTSFLVGNAIEVSGGGASGLSVDQTAAQTGTSAAPATGSTAALTTAESWLAAACSLDGASTAITVGAATPTWTQEFEELSFSHAVGEANSRGVTGALGTTPSCAWTTTSRAWAAVLAAFKGSAAASVERAETFLVLPV